MILAVERVYYRAAPQSENRLLNYYSTGPPGAHSWSRAKAVEGHAVKAKAYGEE